MVVEPALKRAIHSALAADGLSLKDWFLQRNRDYLEGRDSIKRQEDKQ